MVKSSNNIKKFSDEIAKKAIRTVKQETKTLKIKSSKAGTTPKDTGKTISMTEEEIKITGTSIVGKVKVGTDYAIFPYYGTGKMDAGGNTGKPKWTEKTAEEMKIENNIKKGLEV